MNGWLALGGFVWVLVLFAHAVCALGCAMDDAHLFTPGTQYAAVISFIADLALFLLFCFHMGGAL
ncbi:hypothetical protein [Bifidobacterium platyrrhinorum]|uniref:Uncharacterized protein n=1 Tax=Bifidobacterium platyrrhinorum TaxID=2661628 RepID=A0A6L9SSC3_9BIFI|nr:hypothetical protein [Bifidobacterium platyrrhinorum]NEG55424.1 hypothetical protein [Bifidobacterium platyrrhinorum]